MDEAETCRAYVRPRLEAAGWDDELHPIIEQKTFTDGRIVPLKRNKVKRLSPRRADYLLHYTRDFPLAVVEARAAYKLPARPPHNISWLSREVDEERLFF